ncbi:Gloeo_Verruco repeat-containing protein [Singulisphaera sp. GP187]|nr:Gloeo_Verruco repeat-containing protein [Singulisphaera sp. GP187]
MIRTSRLAGLIACGVWVLALIAPEIRGQNVAIPAPAKDQEERVRNPQGVFTLSGSTLYGLSGYGGVKNRGALFAMPVDEGALKIVVSFDDSNGAQPWGNLTIGGANLYGLTSVGGAHNKGTVFRFLVGGANVTTLASFDGGNGANPWGGLTLSPDGSTLYGTTRRGGLKNLGTVFSIPAQGGAITSLASFHGDDGAEPMGELLLIGSTLYGTTVVGGSAKQGTVFQVSVTGGPITVLASLRESDGTGPMGSLALHGTQLYGMTWLGGAHGKGTVFRLPLSGGRITVLASFDGKNGAHGTGSPTICRSGICGVAEHGGADDQGTVFRIPLEGGPLTVLASFNDRQRASPRSTLSLSPDGSTLLGMVTNGGASVPGRLFSIRGDGEISEKTDISEYFKPSPRMNRQAMLDEVKISIRDTVKPKPGVRGRMPVDAKKLLDWSQPVNGLAARIEFVSRDHVIFVRLKNESDRPLDVPTANPSDDNTAALYEIFVQEGAREWRRAVEDRQKLRYFPGPRDDETNSPAEPRRRQPANQQPVDWPWITLRPGEDCIAYAAVVDEPDTGEDRSIKMVLRQPDGSVAGRWRGTVESRPRAEYLSPDQLGSLQATVPFPDQLPPFTHDLWWPMNVSPTASDVKRLHGPNRPMLDVLALYQPAGVRAEFERRMRAERSMPMKLLFAGVASCAESEEAALFLLDAAQKTDYATVVSLHDVLPMAFGDEALAWPGGAERKTPEWLMKLCVAILSDNRRVTSGDKNDVPRGRSLTISSFETEELVWALGRTKCREAVPLLIERVRMRQADWYTLRALGQIGDARAVPALIEGVKQAYFDAQLYGQAVHALGQLKARDAVPVLLEDIDYPECIEALGEIGDSRALPALRAILDGKGGVIREGKRVTPERDAARLYAARIALTYLEGNDGVVRLAEMLDDPNLDRDQRYDVILRLGQRPDPRAVPFLAKVVKTDSDPFVIDLAIGALGATKCRAAVKALIDCFDVPFKEQHVGKGERLTPALYRAHISRNLQQITGQSFGGEKELWLRWWQAAGNKDPGLR